MSPTLSSSCRRACAAALFLAGIAGTTGTQAIEFRHAFDDSVLDVSPREDETFTDAVRSFHATGRDPYVGQADAIAAGKSLYEDWCQSCHLPSGTGRIGPNLIDREYNYDRVASDAGLFEVIFAGAGGAMQSFRTRMTQDEMLKLVAYLRSLQAQ